MLRLFLKDGEDCQWLPVGVVNVGTQPFDRIEGGADDLLRVGAFLFQFLIGFDEFRIAVKNLVASQSILRLLATEYLEPTESRRKAKSRILPRRPIHGRWLRPHGPPQLPALPWFFSFSFRNPERA